jgi:predicted RNA-binding Zn-ribbon protein involved in translation (DUF1610 family)
MPEVEKMICPDCGVEMNYHALKIDYTASLDDESTVDDAEGGVLQEAHTCPACGATHLRRHSSESEAEQS